MAVKVDVKAWLVEHGVWRPFWMRRDEYKAAGDTPAEAQRKALDEFYRPEGESAVAQAQAGASSGGGN